MITHLTTSMDPSFGAVLVSVSVMLIIVSGNIELDSGVTIVPSRPVVIVKRRSSLLLNCSAFTSPEYGPASYQWTRNKVEVRPSKKLHVIENGSLYFQQIKNRKRTEGFYECFLRNTKGKVIARQVQVKVARIANKFTTVPSSVTTSLGGVARFECSIEATPPPTYVWLKDGAGLPHSDRITALDSGVLQIYYVRPDDAGDYSCTAKHSLQDPMNWQESAAATLTIVQDSALQPPTIVAYTNHSTATVDDMITLECMADGNPKPTITWRKEDDYKTPVLEDNFKQKVGEGNLKFKEVVEIDAGMYQCVASSPGNEDAVARVKLDVQAPPLLNRGPKSYLVQSAARIRQHCTVEGTPKPEVTWYKNGKVIKNNGHIEITSNNELLIESVSSDSGYYQCIATNSAGSVMATARINVTRKANTPNMPENVTVTVLSPSQVLMEWDEAATPECCPLLAYIIYYRKNLEKEEKIIQKDTHFLVSNLHPYTEYEFYLMAFNSQGASQETEKIRVTTHESVPSVAPEVKEVTSPSPTSIQVTWSVIPEDLRNGKITKYKIFYKTPSLQEQVVDVPSNVVNNTITGVQPNTDYQIRVLAGTSVGYSILDDQDWPWTTHHTPDIVVEFAATRLQISMVGNDTVLFQWNVTNVSEPITGFQLSVHKILEQDDVKSVVTEINATETSYVMSGLESKKFYEAVLIVQCIDDKVVGMVTQQFQTHDPGVAALPPPPIDLKPRTISSTTIMLSWKPPQTAEEITSYTVRFSKRDNPHHKQMLERSLPSVVLDNLQPFTWYNVSVRSHTAIGVGPYSNVVTVQTRQEVPTAPGNIQINSLTKDKVRVRWMPPANVNGDVIYYVIMYNRDKDQPDSDWTTTKMNGSMTTAVISDLVDDIYYFKLKACTGAGPGPSSPTIQVKLSGCSMDCSADSRITITPTDPQQSNRTILQDQRLGIIVGCSVGLSSIVICILVVVLKQRHYMRMTRQHTTLHLHQNGAPGATPGNYQEARVPMLTENQHSEGQGPGNGIKPLGNGRIIYICSNPGNGNGRLRAVVAEPHQQLKGSKEVMSEQVTLLLDDGAERPHPHPLPADLGNHGNDLYREGYHGSDLSVSYDPSFESISRSQTESPSGTAENSPVPERALNQVGNQMATDDSTGMLDSTIEIIPGIRGSPSTRHPKSKIDPGRDSDIEDDRHSENGLALSSDELLYKMLESTTSSVDNIDINVRRNASTTSSSSSLPPLYYSSLPHTNQQGAAVL